MKCIVAFSDRCCAATTGAHWRTDGNCLYLVAQCQCYSSTPATTPSTPVSARPFQRGGRDDTLKSELQQLQMAAMHANVLPGPLHPIRPSRQVLASFFKFNSANRLIVANGFIICLCHIHPFVCCASMTSIYLRQFSTDIPAPNWRC